MKRKKEEEEDGGEEHGKIVDVRKTRSFFPQLSCTVDLWDRDVLGLPKTAAAQPISLGAMQKSSVSLYIFFFQTPPSFLIHVLYTSLNVLEKYLPTPKNKRR